MTEFERKLNDMYIAYLEEQCHIHPTASVEFIEEEDPDGLGVMTHVIIGGFDSGIKLTADDLLTWFIKNDIRPSELRKYDVEVA